MGGSRHGEIAILRYPNQFLLGPAYVERPSEWYRMQVNGELRLMVHPSLGVCRAEADEKSLILIGYILDSRRPDADNAQIVSELLADLVRFDSFLEKTYRFGGRWIMIVNDGEGSYLFNDAAGHRQVFYTTVNDHHGLWCASQPRILAELTGCRISREASVFIDSYEFRKNAEYRWPGHGSPYDEIMHLLPNHYLDLGTGAGKRYWPSKPLPRKPLEEAAKTASATLKGLIEAAAQRFELAISLTAGLDSRVVLAASRNVVEKNRVMTVRQIDKPDDHVDVRVASQVTEMLGLDHDVIESSLMIDDEFLLCFKENAVLPHYRYAPDAYAIFKRYQRQRVAVTGSISEIGRLSFRSQLGKPESEPIDAYDLARLQKMGRHPYAVNAFEAWLSSLGDIHNIPLLDMFEWEQGHGNWLAMCHMEFDIAWKDLFAPFNCRDLLTLLLSVDPRHRKNADCKLYQTMINVLWPELLKIPINPGENKRRSIGSALKGKIPYPVKKSVKRFFGR
jgi:hypothetical protein